MSTLPNSASVSLAFDTFPAVHACRQAALTADVTPRMQLSSSILVLKMLHSFTEVSPHFSDERTDLHKLPWLPNCLHFLMQPLSPAKTVPVLTSCQRYSVIPAATSPNFRPTENDSFEKMFYWGGIECFCTFTELMLQSSLDSVILQTRWLFGQKWWSSGIWFFFAALKKHKLESPHRIVQLLYAT